MSPTNVPSATINCVSCLFSAAESSHQTILRGLVGAAGYATIWLNRKAARGAVFSQIDDEETASASRVIYSLEMYVKRLRAEMLIAGAKGPVPREWLDSFCMRNFTGSAEFDDTLPIGEGALEAGLNVDPTRLAQAMSVWFTKRGKGDGKPVTVELTEIERTTKS